VIEDYLGPLRIVLPQQKDSTKNNDYDGSSSEEDDEEEEVGRRVEEDLVVGEPAGVVEKSLAFTPIVNANNGNYDTAPLPNTVLENNSVEWRDYSMGSNSNLSNQGGNLVEDGGTQVEDSLSMKEGPLLGQEDGEGGPANSSNISQTVKEGVIRRLTQSENLGCVGKPFIQNDTVSGGKGEVQRRIYSDGPRKVFDRLNTRPIDMGPPQLNSNLEIPKRKPRELTEKHFQPLASLNSNPFYALSLHSHKARSISSQSVEQLSQSPRRAAPALSGDDLVGVERNSSSRFKPNKRSSSSISSAGSILCCSAINSSDIRNCNKVFMKKFELDTANKVWKGATELGVEGDEEEERYVERIVANEKKDEADRLLREQQNHVHP
jgi:hypothetical protein